MWYLIWFISVFFASGLAVIVGLWYGRKEDEK